MKISAGYNVQSKPLSFASNQRQIIQNGLIKNRNVTCFFRDDLDWPVFVDKLINRYKNADKVNVHCFACSDGSEPFSLAMSLLSKLGGKKARKFFPIKASDKDAVILRKPKAGIGEMMESDSWDVNFITRQPSNKFFVQTGKKRWVEDVNVFPVKFHKNVTDAIKFKQADVNKEITTVSGDNSVIMARNFLPYLEPAEQNKFIDEVWKRLGKNSLFVCGDYDMKVLNTCIKDFAKKFRPSETQFCYEKNFAYKENLDSLSNPEFLYNTFVPKQQGLEF